MADMQLTASGQIKNGVRSPLSGFLTPFLLSACLLFLAAVLPASRVIAQSSPIAIESRTAPAAAESLSSENVAAVSEVLPFQAPIEDGMTKDGITEGATARSTEMDGMEGQYQMQLMQRDVMELRGLVEDLTHQIEKMRATQEDRYLELDKRFQDLSRQSPAILPVTGPEISDTHDETGSNPQVTEQSAQDEKTLYETALELIRNRQYDLAITQLQAVIAQYPDGTYAPNAYYWLGEVYAAKPPPDYEAARQALAQVITFFPDHRKVPDAAFKLGKVYNLMGDCVRATDILNQVIEQQKGKSVAKLAQAYLRDKVSCEEE